MFDIIANFVYTTFSYSTAGEAPVEHPDRPVQGVSNGSI